MAQTDMSPSSDASESFLLQAIIPTETWNILHVELIIWVTVFLPCSPPTLSLSFPPQELKNILSFFV